MRVEEGFQQASYSTEHPYTADPVLPGLLKRILPEKVFEADLLRLGDRLVNEIRPLAPLVHPATLIQYDEFGRRVDHLHTSEGWRKIEEFAIQEGYNAPAYERKHGEHSRTFQFVRTMLMTGDCHVVSIATVHIMQEDAELIELYGTDAMKRELVPRFLSRDPSTAYLSGQWMTERPGGSDVSRTETHATPAERLPTDLVHSAGSLARCLTIARAYAGVRAVEGGRTLLKDVPLHVANLAGVALLYRGLVHVVFGAVRLLGRSECGVASKAEEARLRLLTPAIKGYAALRATEGMEEAMTALGGLGYMEETGIGRLIRDAMVEKIWEGTVTVCALDLVRAATKDPQGVQHYVEWAKCVIASVPSSLKQQLWKPLDMLSAALAKLPSAFTESAANPLLPRLALDFFASLSCALYLLEHAAWSYGTAEPTQEEDVEAFRRWVSEGNLAKTEGEIEGVRRAGSWRETLNSRLVYGSGDVSSKL
ncbi:hypothetical protein BN946_scf185015.g18 [Trametes cinnabarina]|uniref:Acyl-CoA dehydrogenase/oxidase C-terminal domain-containing protein n=1 Tax=Pycnoporus cinnabarinus TaxID=5643 RepID=A0A060SH16_PYCCI|nr:hypothetical protein BN946_scf185015.g18 [Trametes cinnabarina]